MREDERLRAPEMEQRIDAALRSYADPGEVPAVRVAFARVVAAADEAQSRQAFPGWRWGLAGVCAAAVLATLGIWTGRTLRSGEIAYVPRPPQAVLPEPARPSAEPPAKGAHVASARMRTAAVRRSSEAPERQENLPKLDVFPAPQPLSDEERSLVRFAAAAAPAARIGFVEAGKRWNQPISVAELSIRPLDVGEIHTTEGSHEREHP